MEQQSYYTTTVVPQPAYAPQQPGYPPGGYGGQPPPPVGYQSSNVVVISQPQHGIPRGNGTCHFCGVGFARENYTLVGILLALFCFPLGVICCLMMTERRCTHCSARI